MNKSMSFVIAFLFAIISVPSFAGSSCTCQPGYTVCSADGGLMSCCTCCQPGSSCGSWSGFGLAGCSCESTTRGHDFSDLSNMSVYTTRFVEFTEEMTRNNMDSKKIEAALNEMIAGLQVEKDPVRGDVVHPKAASVRKFAEVYFAEIDRLRADDNNRKIIDAFLLKIQPK